MPRKPNEIAVKQLELKDAGKTNRVNMKHIIGQFVEIAVGAEVDVRFNAKRYLAQWPICWTGTLPRRSQQKNERKKKKSAKVSSAYVRTYAYVQYVTRITYVDLYNSSILHSGCPQTAAQSTADLPYKSTQIHTEFH